jgi:N-sulfoglucosamine sulfohydrolase
VLLITADDLTASSCGCYGNRAAGATPNIDRLAAEGMRFVRGHVTTAACQPSRQVWMTGRYPHHNGAMGYEPIAANVPTLQEQLGRAGYINGILGKVKHLAPREKFRWDCAVEGDDLGQGRDPARYHEASKSFFERATGEGRPFALVANSHDPHRPFAGSWRDRRWALMGRRSYPAPRRRFRPDEVEVPGFLPDLPKVREEIAQYHASVHRCDETVGEILRALEESRVERTTMVVFMSDHGMSFPFAKTNCYLHSTNVPWIVRWPGRVAPGAVDTEHFVSGIDFMPTILDAVGLPPPEGLDGRSFLPLLRGESQAGRDELYTVFTSTSAGRAYPMRCLQDRRFGYIFNAWANGKRVLINESMGGATYRAMVAAARRDPHVAARVELFRHRVPEELYDLARDPSALRNLADSEEHAAVLAEMRRKTLALMESTGDPLLVDLRERVGA